jgi:uncharacterized protein involved in exopolysaccharide biosynthesis
MTDNFNTHYIITVFSKWFRPIAALVILATIAGGLATLVLPRKYLSVATVVPADPSLSDKAFIYGTNQQELKSIYGKEEDLDRLLATATLDGNLNFLVDSFKLATHYKISGNAEKAKYKSFRQLKKNSRIFKTEYGSVKIQVWDTDKKMAAELANALVERTEHINNENNKKANAAFLKQLENNIERKSSEYKKLRAPLNTDTGYTPAEREIIDTRIKVLLSEIESDIKMTEQLRTAIDAGNPSLVVLEKAYPSETPDKPKLWLWLFASFFGSLFFALLLAIVAESFKKKN